MKRSKKDVPPRAKTVGFGRILARTAMIVIVGSLSFGARREDEEELKRVMEQSAGQSVGCGPGAVRPTPAAEPAGVAGANQHERIPSALAVADLQAEGSSAGDAAVVTALLRGELVRTGRFKIVEKGQMDKILGEQAFQQTGCTSQDCAVKLGRILNVQGIVVGQFGRLMGESFVSISVVEVQTGEIVYADKARATSASDMDSAVMALAGRMAGIRPSGKVSPSPAPQPKGNW